MAQLDWYLRANLKPRHLHLVVALDDYRNVGKVAASMNITQPAVSKALSELERGLEIKLFERTARGMHPTIYGECLIRHARAVLADLTQARDELRGLMSGASGNVRIGALFTAVHSFLPPAVAMFKERSRDTSVLIREGTMDALLPDLWSGKLDLIVGRLPSNRAGPGLKERTLLQEPVTLVARRNHPLASRRRVRWQDLKGLPWVLPPVDSLLRGPIEQALDLNGLVVPANRVETLSVQLLCSYLQLTNAVAFLGKDVARHYHAVNLIVMLPLELPGLLRPLGVAWSRERSLTPSAALMIECLEKVSVDPEKKLAKNVH
jgi:DNA-binding transcriptional LysR family regulator